MAIPLRRTELVKHRIERFFLLVALFYVCLIGRLVYLQALNGGYYREKAARQRAQDIPMVAQRGGVHDREDRPLAVTSHIGVLVCDPTLIKDPAKTAEVIAPALGVTPQSLVPLLSRQKTANGREDRHVILQDDLDPSAAESLRTAISKNEKGSFAGLFIAERRDRSYPAGRDSVHIVGMVKPGPKGRPQGVLGIEQSMNDLLEGSDGYMKAEVDARRRVIPDTQVERVDKRDGVTVKLTIDSTIQHIVNSELEKCCKEYQPEGATAIVLDPKTGDILAMSSYPSFDPRTRAELQKSAEPLANHALSLYEPGSTLKILAAAAALDSNVITPQSTFYCGGSLQIGKKSVHCVMHHGEGAGHGTETIREIIEHSCNVGTAQIGMRLGIDRMEKCLNDFNLLQNTGIGLPADNHGRLGLGTEANRGGLGKVARVAFGQSVMVTPLGLASAYGAIANGGVLMQPRLVLSHEDSNGKTIRKFDPKPIRTVVKPATAAVLTSLLEQVVEHGTGKGSADIPGYRVAGKTGTAQVAKNGVYARGKYLASFIGYLPASNPRAVVLVMVDQPKGAKYYGAQVAAPAFKSIGEQLMWYWKVAPDNPATLKASGSKVARR